MKFPKFRRRDYEEESYAGYGEYDDVYDTVNDLDDEIVEGSYPEDESSAGNGAAFEMKIITPKSYADREEIARCLVMGNAVFVNIEKLDRENIIRLIDYLGGVIYVIDGTVKWSNNSSVIFAPKNVNISGIGDDAEVADEDVSGDDYN